MTRARSRARKRTVGGIKRRPVAFVPTRPRRCLHHLARVAIEPTTLSDLLDVVQVHADSSRSPSAASLCAYMAAISRWRRHRLSVDAAIAVLVSTPPPPTAPPTLPRSARGLRCRLAQRQHRPSESPHEHDPDHLRRPRPRRRADRARHARATRSGHVIRRRHGRIRLPRRLSRPRSQRCDRLWLFIPAVGSSSDSTSPPPRAANNSRSHSCSDSASCSRSRSPRGSSPTTPRHDVFGALVFGLTLSAFLAPPFSGLDTLPSLGVVEIGLGVLPRPAAPLSAPARAIGVAAILALGTRPRRPSTCSDP